VGKIYNDQWMKDRGFLETRSMITARDILSRRPAGNLIAIGSQDLVSEAVRLLNGAGISQIPVAHNGEFVGSLSDTAVLSRLMEDPEIKNARVADLMEPAFPVVDSHLSAEEMSAKMGKDVKALLVRDDTGNLQIITRSDLLMALAAS
jgi:cystathionine beta-synthase